MDIIYYLDAALAALDREVETILTDTTLSLTRKDARMLPLVQQKRVLVQAREDLVYLREHVPQESTGCGMKRFRDDEA